MKNMDKGLTVPKWAMINWPEIPQDSSAQIVCPSPKVWDSDEKIGFNWASVVRGSGQTALHSSSTVICSTTIFLTFIV